MLPIWYKVFMRTNWISWISCSSYTFDGKEFVCVHSARVYPSTTEVLCNKRIMWYYVILCVSLCCPSSHQVCTCNFDSELNHDWERWWLHISVICISIFCFFAASLCVSVVMSCRLSKMPSRRIGRTVNDEWSTINILWFSSLQRHQPFLTCSQIWLLPGAARKARRNEGCARAALSKKNLCNVSLAMCFM